MPVRYRDAPERPAGPSCAPPGRDPAPCTPSSTCSWAPSCCGRTSSASSPRTWRWPCGTSGRAGPASSWAGASPSPSWPSTRPRASGFRSGSTTTRRPRGAWSSSWPTSRSSTRCRFRSWPTPRGAWRGGPLGESRTLRAVGAAGVLMMLLDVVIDPARRARRALVPRPRLLLPGRRRVLRRAAVELRRLGAGRLGDRRWLSGARRRAATRRAPRPAWASPLYYAILAFNLAVTLWIGEIALLAAGILLHLLVFLVLWSIAVGAGTGGDDRPSCPRAALVTWTTAGVRAERSVGQAMSVPVSQMWTVATLRAPAEARRAQALSARPHARAPLPLQPRLRGLRQDPVPGPDPQAST